MVQNGRFGFFKCNKCKSFKDGKIIIKDGVFAEETECLEATDEEVIDGEGLQKSSYIQNILEKRNVYMNICKAKDYKELKNGSLGRSQEVNYDY